MGATEVPVTKKVFICSCQLLPALSLRLGSMLYDSCLYMGKNFTFETTREPHDEKYQVKTGKPLSFTSSFVPSIWELRKGESDVDQSSWGRL